MKQLCTYDNDIKDERTINNVHALYSIGHEIPIIPADTNEVEQNLKHALKLVSAAKRNGNYAHISIKSHGNHEAVLKEVLNQLIKLGFNATTNVPDTAFILDSSQYSIVIHL